MAIFTMSLFFSLIRVCMIIIVRALRFLSPRAWRFDTLDISIKGEIPEELPQTGWVRRFYRTKLAFKDYLFALREARDDPNLKFVILHIKDPELGWGQVSELREAIRVLREAGLITIAVLESADNLSYYLAAACDEIFLVPTGQIMLRGLATEVLFFKGILEKVKVKAELLHAGKYKSASELFTRKNMSTAHREEINDILDSLFDTLVNDLAKGRRLTVSEVRKIIDHGSFLADEAKARGLVDKLCYEDEIEEILEERLQRRPRIVNFSRYSSARDIDLPIGLHFKAQPRIALLYATGPISMGQSSDYAPSGPSAGAESITEALREIRESEDIVGAVVRVSSPGGSALASDLIWREVALGKPNPRRDNPDDKPKPLVVSMGDVAASGGYYISCPADTIIANPTTITGSIGVVTGKFNLKGLLDTVGLGVETVTRGKVADRDSALRGFSPEEKKRLKIEMDSVYDDFLRKVSEGRKMDIKAVKKLAQGRVWTGAQAAQNGLVDRLGGLLTALDEVKEKAGIPKHQKVIVDIFPRKKRFVRVPGLSGSRSIIKDIAMRELFSLIPKDIRGIIPLLRSGKPLSLMPYRLKIY